MKRFLPLVITAAILMLGAGAYLTIDHFGLEALISLISIYGVAGIIFAESGLLIGFFLPGDSLLFTAGFLVNQDVIQFNIHLLVLIVFAAAALGDSVGYAFGKRVGRGLFDRGNSRLFHKDNLRKTEDFYKRHGGKAIVIARFIPVVRTFAPVVAGVSHMKYKEFLTYNIIGAFLWAVGLTYLGYFVGASIEKYGINVEYAILGIIFLSIAPPIYHVLKNKQQRKAIINGITKQAHELFRKK